MKRPDGYSAEVIDAVRRAIAIVDADARVLRMNPAATAVLQSNDGLCTRAGIVEATHSSVNAALRRNIAHAVHRGEHGHYSAAPLICTRPSGRWPYVVHILSAATQALLVVVDPSDRTAPPKALLRRVFGMTDAEATVALCVLNGDGLKPIAERLHLSVATVKTHLQHVFDKTHTHRQAELVGLLLSVMP